MRRGSLGFLATVAVVLLAAACADDDEETTLLPTASPTGAPSEAPLTPARTPTPEVLLNCCADYFFQPDSVDALVFLGQPLSGRITAVALPYNPLPGYDGVPPPTPPTPGPGVNPLKNYTPSPEEINRPHSRPYTIWSVEVINPGTTQYHPGDVIYVGNTAGDWDGKRIQLPGDPMLDVGHEYIWLISPSLDFAEEVDGDAFWVGGPGEFVIDDGFVHTVDSFWDNAGSSKELVGLTADVAMDRLVNAWLRSTAATR
jgi:hypothetical protein